MNSIKAQIIDIQNNQQLNIVKFNFFECKLTMISLELEDDIQIGKYVNLGIKASNIMIAKDLTTQISCENQLSMSIVSIQLGELLCSINLEYNGLFIESIITAKSCKKMNLRHGSKVVALVKASDIYINSICDD